MTSAPSTNHAQPTRYAALDALRFVAAMGVLAFHFTSHGGASWGRPPEEVFPTLSRFTAYGAFGVDLFFVISGFVILMTAWDRRLPQFVASRVGRLAPAYWTAVILATFLLTVLWPGRKHTTIPQALVNLTMFQTALGIPNVNGVYWTLWVELRFYILIAVFVAIGITTQRVIAFAALWPVIAIMAAQTDSDLVADLLISDHAPVFAGGMMLYVLTRNPRSTAAWLVFLVNVALGAGWAGRHSAWIVEINTPRRPGALVQAMLIVLCFALVACTVFGPLSKLRWRWLTLAGALTYPLYLTHEYWGWWFIHLLTPSLPTYVILAIVTIACLAMAWLIHRLVEKPSGPRLRRAVERSIHSLT